MANRDMSSDLQQRLRADLDRAGYYPRLVAGVIDVALAGEEVRAYLVHPETTFDSREVRRHLTALALTPTRLVMAHVDDVPTDDIPSAAATTEAVPLHRIASVALTHGVSDPAEAHGGIQVEELTIAVTWGGAQQVEVSPATCGDLDCDADHGYTGFLTPEDVVVRISAQAEGTEAVDHALAFARELSAATVTAR